VAERCNLVADGFGQSFGETAGAHEKIAPLRIAPWLETLQIREINHRRSSIAQIQNPGISGDADYFDVFKIGQETETDAFSDGLAIWKQTFR
jgi:hypothetical protein